MATDQPLALLDLDGDDYAALWDGVEDAFGLAIPDEAHGWTTVGDIQAWLEAAMPAADQAGKCATSMAFYRLRAALRPLASEPIRPDTALAAFGLSPRRLHRHLSAALDFQVHVQTLGGWAMGGIVLIVAGLGLAFVDVRFLWLLLPGIALVRVDPGLFSPATVGELARQAARAHFAAFAKAGADRRSPAIWAALQSTILDALELDDRSISRQTRLFPATP